MVVRVNELGNTSSEGRDERNAVSHRLDHGVWRVVADRRHDGQGRPRLKVRESLVLVEVCDHPPGDPPACGPTAHIRGTVLSADRSGLAQEGHLVSSLM